MIKVSESELESLINKIGGYVFYSYIPSIEVLTKICEKYPKVVDWSAISQRQPLTIEFITKFNKYLNWEIISRFQPITIEFATKFSKYLNWHHISRRTLSEEFLNVFKDQLNWHHAYRCATLDFLIQNEIEIPWGSLILRNKLNETEVLQHLARIKDSLQWKQLVSVLCKSELFFDLNRIKEAWDMLELLQ